ncbi:MAG: methyltransferase domain-containing protein [Bacteroidales bacterium]|nr:methyltransferase domain-containing protein [Bacteroidales bacterium]
MDESRTILSEADRLRHEELWGSEGYFQNARKPEGEDGRVMIRRMNGGAHALLAAWGFKLLDGIVGGQAEGATEPEAIMDAGCGNDPAEDAAEPEATLDAGDSHVEGTTEPEAILDAGCGGGANLARWMDRCPGAKLTGLDFSPISVNESRRFNAEEISAGRCSVVQGDVMQMPFAENSFDCVSAFETVYFWPDIARAFAEVKRVLKPGGIFFICNESDALDQRAIDACKLIRGMRLYKAEELQVSLEQAGFGQIKLFRQPDTHYLAVIAKKLLSSKD